MRELRISKTSLTTKDVRFICNAANKYPLLTVEEEVELASKIHNGDMAAKEKLVNSNIRFVISVAKQYVKFSNGTSITLEDLISEGLIGLIRAAENYDETKGFKFISYAVWWIRQALNSYCSDRMGIVRLPINVNNDLIATLNAKDEFLKREGRQGSEDEIKEMLEAKKKKYVNIYNKAYSLDAPIKGEDGESQTTLLDLMSSDQEPKLSQESLNVLKDKLHSILVKRKERMSERDFNIFWDKLMFKDGDDSVEDKYGMCRERVRQIVDRTVFKLQRAAQNGLIKTTDFFE